MSVEAWLAGAGLIVTIFLSAGAVIWKLAENKASILAEIGVNREAIDNELTAIRLAAFEEYKTLRKELAEVKDQAHKDFGETVKGVREKVNQVELWVRDELSKYLLKHDYERDMDDVQKKLTKLEETIERRFDKFEAKLDERPNG